MAKQKRYLPVNIGDPAPFANYSEGTYYGGAGLPTISREGQVAQPYPGRFAADVGPQNTSAKMAKLFEPISVGGQQYDVASGQPSGGGLPTGSATATGAMIGGPVGAGIGLAVDVGSLIFKMADTWQRNRKAEKAQKKAEQRYNNWLAEESKRYNQEVEMWQKQFNLTRKQVMQNMKIAQEQMRMSKENNKFARQKDFSNRMLQMFNDPVGKSQWINILTRN